MKILLINQPWICNRTEYGLRAGVRWPQVRRRDRSMPYYSFPFALAYATSYLLANGIDASLRDSIALEETKEEALQYISENGFDLVVLETSTPSIKYDLEFCDSIKEAMPQSIVCLSGQHSTALPDEVLHGSKADYVFIGEYEKALINLITSISSGISTVKLRGVAMRRGGLILNNGREALIHFDELPSPYRDRALVSKYNEPSARFFPNAAMITSRGCSFKCTFCIEASVNYGTTSSFRYRSLDNIRQEICSLVEDYGVKEIFFDDAFFTTSHANEIADLILDLPFRVRWSCWIDRAADEQTLIKMKKSGCSGVKFGVETFDEAIGLAAKKRVAPHIVQMLVDRCRRIGLLTHASYIFGLPGETRKSLDHTLGAAVALNTTSFQFSIATPIPGTEFYDQAKRNGWLTTNDWSRYEGQGSSVLRYDDITGEDLVMAMGRARKMKIMKLLTNPPALIMFVIKLVRIMGLKGFLYDAFRKAIFLIRSEKVKGNQIH